MQWVMGRFDLAKVGVDVDAIGAEQTIRVVIIGAIEKIEDLDAEGQHLSLPTNG